MTDWPDWSGETVAIVASGPSAKTANVQALKGVARVVAIKKSFELVPFADAVYGCDFPWWRDVRGLPDFKGLKLAYADRAVDSYGCRKVHIDIKRNDDLRFDAPGHVGGGGNSGFQALNLVAQWGAAKVILVGFDMHDRSGVHWYGRNNWHGGANPSDHNFRRWVTALNAAAPVLAARGIEVVNASTISAVTAFPRRTIAEALQQWELIAA